MKFNKIKVKTALVAADMKVNDVALLTELTRETISKTFNGHVGISKESALKVADALGVELEDIIEK